jgi:hypothetical protein
MMFFCSQTKSVKLQEKGKVRKKGGNRFERPIGFHTTLSLSQRAQPGTKHMGRGEKKKRKKKKKKRKEKKRENKKKKNNNVLVQVLGIELHLCKPANSATL